MVANWCPAALSGFNLLGVFGGGGFTPGTPLVLPLAVMTLYTNYGAKIHCAMLFDSV